ncbi:TonB-dependent siderophore receptor [Vibrio scophthalmi]|uniref:TonB-dependent siderophore receptor n=1 Tax=Vibrio scophthalmi TaxID=45658 RepID=UPI0038732D0C
MERVKRSVLIRTLVGMAVSCAINSASANEENSYFDEVVVWGTKVSSNTESLGAGDMSLKQADHMSDLLRDIPGVDVGGTHSVNQRITIRGLGETDLDIRLDGASQHANMFHHIGNLTLNPDILKSVDIQVGNNSVVQSGLGGSVYFETKDAKDLLRDDETFGARLYGGYASNDSEQGSLTLYGRLSEGVDSMLYIHGVDRNNFKDGDGNDTFGSEGEVYNVLAKLGFEPTDGHRIEFSYDVYRDEGDYSARPDRGGAANLAGRDGGLLLPTEYDRDTIRLGYEFDTVQHHAQATLYSSTTEIIRDETATGWTFLGRASENTAKNQNVGLNAKVQSELDLFTLSNTVTYGVDYMDKRSSSAYGGVEYMDEDAISTALFLEDQIAFSDRFALTLGVRYDHYQRNAETGDKDFDDFTWAIAADWSLTDSFSLFASTRTLFKAPELLESFIAFQQVAELDEDIKPETGRNTQGGFKFNHWVNQHYFGANLTVFKTEIDDYITEEYVGATGGYLIKNAYDIELTGFELSAVYGYDAFTAKASYSQTDSENLTNGGPYASSGSGARSKDIGDTIALTLDYQWDDPGLIIGWTSIVVEDENNVLEGNEHKPGYDVHNMYVQWVPSSADRLSVTFGVDNLFDETYVSHASTSGISRGIEVNDYEPGRNYKLSAAYQF